MPTTRRHAALFKGSHEPKARRVLAEVGLRPSRQRQAIYELLFTGVHRHVSVEGLHQEASVHGIEISRATVYNTLKQFDEVGLVRRIAVPSDRHHYDTDVGDHHHFYIASEDRITDIPNESVAFRRMPAPPPGYAIAKVDVVVHLEPLDGASTHDARATRPSASRAENKHKHKAAANDSKKKQRPR